MKLIIAEKPSLARNIAGAIGNLKRKDGYFYGDEYIVTWAFGHLFSLADIEHYSPSNEPGWTLSNIPCFPAEFTYLIKKDQNKVEDAGARKQFEIIKSLILNDKVDMIINAGDADREGEIIVRTIVRQSGADKPFKRLWLPDQTEETIREGLNSLKDETEYDNLAKEGYARTYIDWVYGVNLTRYATLKAGTLLRVGRVIVPIVKAVYDRDLAIRNFVSEKYYSPLSKEETKGEEIELLSKKKFFQKDMEEALSYISRLNGAKAVVTEKKTKKDTLSPGKLYSLTKLQSALGKKYKMSMEESLKILQGLYEKGYITYPRTNSEYLAKAEAGKIKKVIECVNKLGYELEFKNKKTIFDDSKIESHSALTPTYKIPDKNTLTEAEQQVYGTIVRRFAAVFAVEDCIVEKTEIVIDAGDIETFTLKGIVMLQKGWTKYDDYTKKDKVLPALEKGEEVNTLFTLTEKETTPPKHYTIETLNNYLKNPFREDLSEADGDDQEEYRAIFEGLELGTEATRTGIIDNAKRSKYIELKKDVYTILPGGEYLINSLSAMGISMDKYKTSEIGKALKKVYRGEMTIKESVELAKKEIKEVFDKKGAPNVDMDTGFFGDVVGVCPVCKKNVVKGRYAYRCEAYKNGCEFKINEEILKRRISKANVEKLLKDGRSYKIDGFISTKTGKSFSATLKIEDGRVRFDF